MLVQKVIVEQVHAVTYRDLLSALPSEAGGRGRHSSVDNHGRIHRGCMVPRHARRRVLRRSDAFRRASAQQALPVQHLLHLPGLVAQLPFHPALPGVDSTKPAKGFALLPSQLADTGDQVSLQVAGGSADSCPEAVDLHQQVGELSAEFPRAVVILLEGGEQVGGQPVPDFVWFLARLAVTQPVRQLFEDTGEITAANIASDAAQSCRQRASASGLDKDGNEGRGTEQRQNRWRAGATEPSRLLTNSARYLILRN
jgi:hypothetical protein